MGADIHLFIEYSWVNGSWSSWSGERELEVQRSYALFRLLAGVRGEASDALYPVRGYPKDVSWDIREEHQDINCHSHSWLTLGEFSEVLERYKSLVLSQGGLPWGWAAVCRAADELSREMRAVRLVFCFDN